jgi:hypothetical protein
MASANTCTVTLYGSLTQELIPFICSSERLQGGEIFSLQHFRVKAAEPKTCGPNATSPAKTWANQKRVYDVGVSKDKIW